MTNFMQLSQKLDCGAIGWSASKVTFKAFIEQHISMGIFQKRKPTLLLDKSFALLFKKWI